MRYLLRIVILIVIVIALLISPGSFFQAPVQATPTKCATQGKDGEKTVTANVNTYFSSVSGTINAGATSITLGTKTPAAAPDISVGDLLLIIQMQDADFNNSNTNLYGDNTAFSPSLDPPSTYNSSAGGSSSVSPQPSDGASGWTNLNNAGHYEFVTVTGISGNTVNIGSPIGGLVYTYRSDPNATLRRSYQIIRVPQYTNVTLSGGQPEPWNGTTGGVFVIDVAQTLTLSGGVAVEASGTGFRGGAGRSLGGSGSNAVCNGQICRNTDYRTPATVNTNGSKGEGIAGTPRYVLNYFNPFNLNSAFNPVTTPTLTNTGVEGYPNGSYGRGAPGNAGGGSTDGTPNDNAQNSGGGGGSNGGRGGRGGRAWSSQAPTGGFGGKGFDPSIINNGERLFMGGGGGAGTTNNSSRSISRSKTTNYNGTSDYGNQQVSRGNPNQDAVGNGIYSSGAAGGGIVIIRTGSIAGSGTIRSQGAPGLSSGQDGAGGGGAGGTVYIDAKNPANLANITVDVRGGAGGWSTFRAAHGPGGGGGGGVVISTNSGVTIAPGGLDGGAAGETGSDGNANPPNFGGEQGSGLATKIEASTSPGVSSGAFCSTPNVLLVKRITAINENRGDTRGSGENMSVYKDDPTYLYDDNVISDPKSDPPETTFWPEPIADFLKGAINGGEIEPGDSVEYTIYFLSTGLTESKNVLLCDRLPSGMEFEYNGYKTDKGILLNYNGTETKLTNVGGDDQGRYFPPSVEPSTVYPGIKCGGLNTNGAIVVDLGNLPPATVNIEGKNNEPKSYGYVRFRAKFTE